MTGQPILRICTTGSKASVLSLPPGRRVLRFLLQAPHGYHVEMASQTPFVYGDEDTVMACLTKVSFLSCKTKNKQATKENYVGVLLYSTKVNLDSIYSASQTLRQSLVVTCLHELCVYNILALKVFLLWPNKQSQGIIILWTKWGCYWKLVVMLLLSLPLKFIFFSIPILIISISSFSTLSVSFTCASARVA